MPTSLFVSLATLKEKGEYSVVCQMNNQLIPYKNESSTILARLDIRVALSSDTYSCHLQI